MTALCQYRITNWRGRVVWCVVYSSADRHRLWRTGRCCRYHHRYCPYHRRLSKVSEYFVYMPQVSLSTPLDTGCTQYTAFSRQ